MSEWRGVFDHADHYSTGSRASCGRCGEWCASCGRCGEWCYPHDPCSCCEKQALGDQTAAEVLAELDALRASVQRVRDLCDALRRTHQDYAAMVIEMTLDGGESDE